MFVDFLLERFAASRESQAIIWRDRPITYGQLLEDYQRAVEYLRAAGLPPYSVVALEADFSPRAVAFLLALVGHGAIVVPLTATVAAKKQEFRATAQVEHVIKITGDDEPAHERTGLVADHELLLKVKALRHPALILFSSGTTGKSKAALHDFLPLLEKFQVPRKSKRMISFLMFDHIGGLNTLFYALSNTGTLVTLRERSPRAVVDAIAAHGVQILPTSPTFLNLLIISEAYKGRDLRALELITYGTEPMPESTLRKIKELLPWVELQQTYGLSELGIMRSKSKSSDSLWVRIGGEGFETRVCDGMLEIKAKSAMLGYLNYPSPFTADGWFKTGDLVETDGEFYRILGRKSDIINVGGEKVYPAEVESVILSMPGVEEAVVTGEVNALVGQMVVAVVKLLAKETLPDFRVRMRQYMKEKGLPGFKVPQKVVIVEDDLYSQRFKKVRSI